MKIHEETLINTSQIIYKKIKKFYNNNPPDLLNIIFGFLLVMTIRLIILSLDAVFIADDYSIQYILFLISTWLLITGMEIGYTKFILMKLDNLQTKLTSIFEYYNILHHYVLGILMNCCILLFSIIPAIVYIYIKYGSQIFDVFKDSLNDPYYQELINAYFNSTDIAIISLLILVPCIYFQLRFCFWNYYLIDTNCTVMSSFQKSWDTTKLQELKIFTYFLIFIFFNVLGLIAGIIGLCFTMPVSYLFFCQYYRVLKK